MSNYDGMLIPKWNFRKRVRVLPELKKRQHFTCIARCWNSRVALLVRLWNNSKTVWRRFWRRPNNEMFQWIENISFEFSKFLSIPRQFSVNLFRCCSFLWDINDFRSKLIKKLFENVFLAQILRSKIKIHWIATLRLNSIPSDSVNIDKLLRLCQLNIDKVADVNVSPNYDDFCT